MRSERLPEQHTRIPPRASPVADHTAGQHGEDQTSTTGPQRWGSAPLSPDVEDEGALFPTRAPRSAIRYQTSGQRQPTRQVMAQAPRAVMVYRTRGRTQTSEHPPIYPTLPPPARRRHRVHWLLYVGLSLCIMLLGWVSLSVFFQWWQITQDDWHYGRPRTFQIDAVVGHGDSPTSPSHFIALNLSGHIEVMEFPGGDAAHAKIYLGPTLIGQGEDLAVVTIRFKDVNGDGKPDMLVSVQDSTIIFLNENGQFRPLKTGEHVTL